MFCQSKVLVKIKEMATLWIMHLPRKWIDLSNLSPKTLIYIQFVYEEISLANFVLEKLGKFRSFERARLIMIYMLIFWNILLMVTDLGRCYELTWVMILESIIRRVSCPSYFMIKLNPSDIQVDRYINNRRLDAIIILFSNICLKKR